MMELTSSSAVSANTTPARLEVQAVIAIIPWSYALFKGSCLEGLSVQIPTFPPFSITTFEFVPTVEPVPITKSSAESSNAT